MALTELAETSAGRSDPLAERAGIALDFWRWLAVWQARYKPQFRVIPAVTSETSFLDISGIASIPVLGKSVLTEGPAGALYQVGREGRLTACCCRDRLDVPRSRYAEVTVLG